MTMVLSVFTNRCHAVIHSPAAHTESCSWLSADWYDLWEATRAVLSALNRLLVVESVSQAILHYWQVNCVGKEEKRPQY